MPSNFQANRTITLLYREGILFTESIPLRPQDQPANLTDFALLRGIQPSSAEYWER